MALQRAAGWDTDSIDVRTWLDSQRAKEGRHHNKGEDAEDLEDCEIDQLPSWGSGMLEPRTFLQKYLSAGRPVRLVGAADGWPMRTNWTKHHFAAELGHLTVGASQVTHPAEFAKTIDSYVSVVLSLDEFVGIMSLPFPWPAGKLGEAPLTVADSTGGLAAALQVSFPQAPAAF